MKSDFLQWSQVHHMGLSGALLTLVESNRTPVETKVARGRRTIEASGAKWSIRKPNRAQVNLMESRRARRTPKEPIVEQERSEVILYPVEPNGAHLEPLE